MVAIPRRVAWCIRAIDQVATGKEVDPDLEVGNRFSWDPSRPVSSVSIAIEYLPSWGSNSITVPSDSSKNSMKAPTFGVLVSSIPTFATTL